MVEIEMVPPEIADVNAIWEWRREMEKGRVMGIVVDWRQWWGLSYKRMWLV